MFPRFLRRLRRLGYRLLLRLLGQGDDDFQDPEALLSRAQREMMEIQARNRDRAVQAITRKNNLRLMVEDTQKRLDRLQERADAAADRGDHEQARQLLREKEQYARTLSGLRESAAQAEETVEAVKRAIQREEARLRENTAAILALKAQWKNRQIEIAMNRALEGIGVSDTDRAFERAAGAIVRKNELGQMAEDTQKRIDALEAEARLALRHGDGRRALALLRERESLEKALNTAVEAVAALKAMLGAPTTGNGPDDPGH